VIEFSDFECPFCGKFARESGPKFQATFIDTGRVRLGFWHYPISRIHKNARAASQAAYCAGQQGEFWRMHDLLFARQGQLQPPDLRARADSLGLDVNQFQTCLNSKSADSIEASARAAEGLGITGTPAFLVGGFKMMAGFKRLT